MNGWDLTQLPLANCTDSVAYEWRDPGGGVVRYTHAPDKRPDTNQDLLSVGIITPSFDAVILRIDSHRTANNNDFLQLEIVSFFLCVICVSDWHGKFLYTYVLEAL